MKVNLSNLKFALLCLIAFIIPCYIYLTPLCIIIYVLVWVLDANLIFKIKTWFKNKYALLFCGFYFLYALGLIYTPDIQNGAVIMQVKICLGLFPILLVSEGELSFKKQRILIWSFISGCCLNALICLGYACWNYFKSGIFRFTYMQFSLFLHPSYYSMYIDVAILLAFYLMTAPPVIIQLKEKIILLLITFFLLYTIILLESKTGWICTFLLLVVLFLRLFIIHKYKVIAIALTLLVIILLVLNFHSLFRSPASRFNIVRIIASTGKLDSSSAESTQARYFAGKAAQELIIQRPFIGYGTGEAWTELQNQYKKDKFTGPLKKELNAHNQYLQTALDIGIIGCLYMVACFVLPLIKAIRERKFYYGMFILIFMFNIAVESMLEQQAGTMFYGLFNSLLMFNFVI